MTKYILFPEFKCLALLHLKHAWQLGTKKKLLAYVLRSFQLKCCLKLPQWLKNGNKYCEVLGYLNDITFQCTLKY